MITLLSYPRSGRNLLRHMLKCINIEVYATHRPVIHQEWPLKQHDKLIMLVRDYTECIPRHLYSEKIVSSEMIGKMFGREFSIRDRASQYIENLVLFDLCQSPKYIIYYEDVIKNKKHSFSILCDNIIDEWDDEIENRFIELDWDKEAAISLKNYDAPALSNGDLDYHKQRVRDIPLMHKVIKDTNKYIFEKYLYRYELQKV